MSDTIQKDDPEVHLKVLFSSLSDEDGTWLGWGAIITTTTASGKEITYNNFVNKVDGYLDILETLKKDGYEVSKEDLRINLGEDGTPSSSGKEGAISPSSLRSGRFIPFGRFSEEFNYTGPMGGTGEVVFVLEKDL